MKHFEGRVAVVTGAASGIGLGLARRFLKEGMKVVLADIDPGLESVVNTLRAEGGDALAVHTDVSEANQVEALAARTIEAYGAVHVVCNNAGTGGACAFRDLSLEDWKFEIGVDLWGVIHGTKIFLPFLERQREGHIVNVSSMGGVFHGPFIAPYTACKAAVVALTETLHHELAIAGSNVHVSVLCTGAVVSRMNDEPNVPGRFKMNTRPAIPEVEAFRRSIRESFASDAMQPDVVANRVMEAIVDERLFIMTHPEFAPVVKNRFDTIVSEIERYRIS
jgi:NAD(P)-dependent dehydrogenase (short-subunit alcohol dehydrogenase family)